MRITVSVNGIVQGVGYRFYVMLCARESRVTGYVRNNSDGSVEVVAEGGKPALERFLELLWARGDDLIRVNDLQVKWGKATGEFSKFDMRW